MSAILRVSDLHAGYGAVPVLHGTDLAFDEGKVCGLVGPNGHGKSTLLRAISGLLRAKGGSIEYAGTDIRKRAVHEIVDLGLIHVPQGDMLFSQMSVQDNLLVGATRPAAMAAAKDRLAFVFDLLPKLKERHAQSASTLSGGERRMVAIGRGLMAGGRLLMLDEPSLGLAPAVINEIYEVIRKLAGTGQSVLLVEENVARATEVADVMALMDHGKIVWSGPPAEMSEAMSFDQTYFGG